MNAAAKSHDEFWALLNKQEDLDPELARCIEESDSGWRFLKHPLIVTMYHEQQNAMFNEQLRVKKAYLQEKLDAGDYEGAIWFHERPYRPRAFATYGHKIALPERADMVLDLWTDQEFPSQYTEFFPFWFAHYAPQSPAMLKSKGKLAGRKSVTVYRGCSAKEAAGRYERGMAWTTKVDTARWFAKRWAKLPQYGAGVVLKAVIPVEHVYAMNDTRNEAEVIVNPAKLQRLKEVT